MSVMSLQVLSLNKVYSPLGLISVKEAVDAIFSERAEIIEEEENGGFSNHDVSSWLELSEMKNLLMQEGEEGINHIWINSVEPYFIAPRVIRYLHYDKSFIKQVKFSRRNIILRDNYTCAYCNKKLPLEQLQLEHIIPKSRGGKTTWTNTITACIKCNQKKGNRTPKEAGMKLHWKPTKPKFLPKNQRIIVRDPRYKFWEQFVSDLYWSTELQE